MKSNINYENNKKSDSSIIFRIFIYLGMITGSSIGFLLLIPDIKDAGKFIGQSSMYSAEFLLAFVLYLGIFLLVVALLLVANLFISLLIIGLFSIVRQLSLNSFTMIMVSTLGIAFNIFVFVVFMKVFSVGLYNYENEMTILAEPLERQYFSFLQKNKRTPSILESASLLKAAGCIKVIINKSTYDQEYTCLFAERNILFSDRNMIIEYSLDGEAAVKVASRKNLRSGVYMKFYNSVCLFGFDEEGEPRRFETEKKLINKIECRTSPNFRIDH